MMPKPKESKRRKNYELAPKHLEMLGNLRQSLGLNSEAEVLRYCIAHTWHLQQCLAEGMQLQVVDKDGKSRGLVFI